MKIQIHKPGRWAVEDVRMRDATIFEMIAVDPNGYLTGRIIGGHDGIDERPLPFSETDVEAYRYRGGIAYRLGMRKWITFQPAK